MSIKSNANHYSSCVHFPPQVKNGPCSSECESPRLHASHFRRHSPRQVFSHRQPWPSRQGSVCTSTPVTGQALRVHSVCQRTESLQVADICNEDQLTSGSVPSPTDSGTLSEAYVTNGTQHGPQERCMGTHEVLRSLSRDRPRSDSF
jgi:hypothetical protein